MSSKKVSFTVCNGDLTLLLNGKNVSIPKDHIAYNQIKEALKKSAINYGEELKLAKRSSENTQKNKKADETIKNLVGKKL